MAEPWWGGGEEEEQEEEGIGHLKKVELGQALDC
jgi:hypothetical protein